MTINEIITAYINGYREAVRSEMAFFRSQPSLADAISNAVRPYGRKHDHQYRIPPALLVEVERRLHGDALHLRNASDFDALHSLVAEKAGIMVGIGPVTVYDVAHRIGLFLGKEPAVVYLHAGTKAGAAALGLKGNAIHPDRLPAAFSRLSPAEIEDCLCIYKDALRSQSIRTRQSHPASHCSKPPSVRVRIC